MADALKEKAKKHAAAKKKVKEYQQRLQLKKTENEQQIKVEEDSNPVHNLTTSNVTEHQQSNSPLHNYFGGQQPNTETPVTFFDNLTSTQENLISFNGADTDALAVDDPELKQNEIYNIHHPEIENQPLYSNTESLRQLSSQLSHLLREDNVVPEQQSDLDLSKELEKRNQELVALLNEESMKKENLQLKIPEYEDRIRSLEHEMQQLKTECEIKMNRELGPLQEQLKCHAQTIGILVGEKTELTHSLNQSQLIAKLKSSECDELQGRLKTSRSRVADLEKEMQFHKAEKLKIGNSHDELEIMRKQLADLKLEKEETVQDCLQLREKLNLKENENINLKKELNDLSHQLSLNQVKLQQITTDGTLQIDSKVDNIIQEKFALEKQVSDLKQDLKNTLEEKEQSNLQYQQYVEQLNKQIASLATRLESMSEETENLAKREHNLVKHIGELEKAMQHSQDRNENKGNGDLRKQLSDLKTNFDELKRDKEHVEGQLSQVMISQQKLLLDLEERDDVIRQLKIKIEILESSKPDSAKLLAVMESDQIAASRAVQQNTELKQQLEEMQNVFVKMSNDKLELTDMLSTEQYKTKEFSEKIHQYESHLQKLTDAIAIKDKELTHIRDQSTQLNKQLVQQDQLTDRLRHYEAQEGGIQALQIELHELRHQIQQLQAENLQLKGGNLISNSADGNPITDVDSDPNSALTAKINNLQLVNEELQKRIKELETIESQPSNHEVGVDALDSVGKDSAMKHLEEKLLRTMNDIATLTEEKQRLEHLVIQLQVETETVGEYITLYQHQRGVLQQRTQERDEQLITLAKDREAVRAKLDVLNGLVRKLVHEKCDLTPEFLHKHEEINKQSDGLCDEHAKMRKEISEVAEENVLSPRKNSKNDSQTAEQIMTLLSEIKSSSLVQPTEGLENFHPCAWCSGQLITV